MSFNLARQAESDLRIDEVIILIERWGETRCKINIVEVNSESVDDSISKHVRCSSSTTINEWRDDADADA